MSIHSFTQLGHWPKCPLSLPSTESTVIENKNRNVEEANSIAVAEESRELDWKSKSFMASLFMGDLDMAGAFPFPQQDPADKAEGDELLARIRAYCLAHVDGDAIDRSQQIPAHIFKGLQDLGLFGIKIPKEYGGLGMSQTNYMRILAEISLYCGSIVATLSAHQSIGVPQPLKLFGTPEQKQEYLPKLAAGWISAFALTESSVGSDPANMQTVAELSEDGTHWLLSGEKLWCTNGVIADLFVVMARTPDKVIKGKPRKQISAFIVEADWAGVDVVHRCSFLGIRAIENGLIRFKDVKVPVENLVLGEGQGLKLALTTLNDGRLGIPAICAAGAVLATEQCATWAKSRVQWGKAIGYHEAGSDKLARIASAAYAMDTLSRYTAALSDHGGVDLRMEAATAKMFNTEIAWEVADTTLQLRAGRGFETESSLEARGEHSMPIERCLRDSRINRIVEGTTDVMHLFLARESLDMHLKLAGPLFGRASLGTKLATLLRAGRFYATWYPKLWLGGIFRSFGGFDPMLGRQLRWVDRQTRKLARKLFHQMLLQGPKLEMRQLTLNRFIDIGTELSVMALVTSRLQGELKAGDDTHLKAATYWLTTRRHEVERLFRELSHNADAQARSLAKELMDGAEELPALEPLDLAPLPRERGRDLTSGRQAHRLDREPVERAAK